MYKPGFSEKPGLYALESRALMASPTTRANAHADLPYYLAFARVKGIGPARLKLLKNHFDSMADAWDANLFQLTASGLDGKSVNSLLASPVALPLSSAPTGSTPCEPMR